MHVYNTRHVTRLKHFNHSLIHLKSQFRATIYFCFFLSPASFANNFCHFRKLMSFTNVAANFHTFNNWNVGGRDFHLCKSVLTVRHATTASNGLETVRCCSSPYLGRHVRREEVELYMDGSMCHRGCSGHQSCHCWLNESGKNDCPPSPQWP